MSDEVRSPHKRFASYIECLGNQIPYSYIYGKGSLESYYTVGREIADR